MKNMAKIKEAKDLALEVTKTVQHHFPGMYRRMEDIADPRKNKQYRISEIVFGAISLFLFKCGSRNAYDNLIEEKKFRKNYTKLFGLHLPKLDAVADVLKQLPEAELEELKNDMIHTLIEKRVFDKWRYYGEFMIAIDGSGITSYKEKHCDQCLQKTYNKGRDNEKKVWYHNVLEAKLVTSNGFSISLGTVWIENPDQEYNKQDCERKAFERLAKKLKKNFPRTAICICADGLYPYDNFFKTCEKNNWSYIVTLKEKSLKNLWKSIRLQEREHIPIEFEEHAVHVEQKIQWINNEEFNEYTHNWIQIDEKRTNSNGKISKYKFVFFGKYLGRQVVKGYCDFIPVFAFVFLEYFVYSRMY